MFLSLGLSVCDDTAVAHELVLLVDLGLFCGVMRKAFQERYAGGWVVVVRFIGAKIKTYPQVPDVLTLIRWQSPPGRLEAGLAARKGQLLGPQAHTYPHQAQKDQGPEILCHWPCIGRAPKALAVQFIPCQTLVPFTLCPVGPASLCSWLHSSQHCAAAPDPPSQGCSSQAHVAAQNVRRKGTGNVCAPPGRDFVNLWSYFLQPGKEQIFFQTNQCVSCLFAPLCWALTLSNPFPRPSRFLPASNPILSPGYTPPLDGHCPGSHSLHMPQRRKTSPVPSWLPRQVPQQGNLPSIWALAAYSPVKWTGKSPGETGGLLTLGSGWGYVGMLSPLAGI